MLFLGQYQHKVEQGKVELPAFLAQRALFWLVYESGEDAPACSLIPCESYENFLLDHSEFNVPLRMLAQGEVLREADGRWMLPEPIRDRLPQEEILFCGVGRFVELRPCGEETDRRDLLSKLGF